MTNTTADTQSKVEEEFEAAKKAALEAYSNFLDAKIHLKKAAVAAGIEFRDSTSEHLDEAIIKARGKQKELQETTSDYVRDNPLTSISIAFVSGVILSRIFGK
ncbi:MAG: DUF883 C-terminal domain-containing protein [Pseudomonadota bacterium]